MAEPSLSFFARFMIAVRVFIRIVVDPVFAAAVWRLRQSPEINLSSLEPAVEATAFETTNPDSALQLLGLLQRDGRLIDFLEEDVAQYSDADVGAAVRVVHEGCRKVLQEHFTIAPVLGDREGASITLDLGFDATAIRPTGNIVGEPPFKGTLAHCGWRVTEVKLPKLAAQHDTAILAPAEVEL